jgi:hypothetical protein
MNINLYLSKTASPRAPFATRTFRYGRASKLEILLGLGLALGPPLDRPWTSTRSAPSDPMSE